MQTLLTSQRQRQMAFTFSVCQSYPNCAEFVLPDLYAKIEVAYANRDRNEIRRDGVTSVIKNNIRWFLYHAVQKGMLAHAGSRSALYQKLPHPAWENYSTF